METLSPDDIRAKLEAGRQAAPDGLRRLADQLESVPLADAADALAWLQDRLAELQREADRIFAAR